MSKMRKIILFTGIGILFMLGSLNFASADINCAASANGAIIVETAGSGTRTYTINEIIDGNQGTYYQRYTRDRNGDSTANTYTTLEITFANPVAVLNNIIYKWYERGSGGGAGIENVIDVDIWINQDGLLTKVSNNINHQVTVPGPWNDVTGIRAYFRRQRHADYFFTSPTVEATVRVYEIEAWGFIYQDIGLRVYNGNETIAIAAEPTGTLTSPLRIAKNGVIYGIVLVDPGDPNDSGVRIQTSSGIKALRKYP